MQAWVPGPLVLQTLQFYGLKEGCIPQPLAAAGIVASSHAYVLGFLTLSSRPVSQLEEGGSLGSVTTFGLG